jgi:hypothetical protein
MNITGWNKTDDAPTTNFVRAHLGETLTSDEILGASRRIILVSASRGRVNAIDAFAMIELPLARRWEGRDLVIVGTQFCLAPHGQEIMRGDVGGHHAVRLVPLLSDREDEPDAWTVIG